jgi:hypothetical protein
MFHRRSTEFDPRVSAIAGHLRAIEKELGEIGRSAGQNASASAATAGNQIAEAIWPKWPDTETPTLRTMRRLSTQQEQQR